MTTLPKKLNTSENVPCRNGDNTKVTKSPDAILLRIEVLARNAAKKERADECRKGHTSATIGRKAIVTSTEGTQINV